MKHRDPSAAEVEQAFLRHQAEVAQAISGKQELSVSVGLNRLVDEPLAGRDLIMISRSAEATPADATRHMRGQVDLAALALKHHDGTIHEANRPLEPEAAATFDALEQIRLESIGAEKLPGMRHNLAQRHQTSFEYKGYDTAEGKSMTALPDVVAMIAREAVTGAKPPAAIQNLVASMRPWVESATQNHLGQLALFLDKSFQYF